MNTKKIVIVFTGTPPSSKTRVQYKAEAEGLGFLVSGSVSSKTTLVVFGEGVITPKTKKAKELGVETVTYDHWDTMVWGTQLGVFEPYQLPALNAAMQQPISKTTKPSNPKEGVGIRKWRQFTTIPLTVMSEIGAALLEGALKYGRHNYRVAGVRASVYVDAAIGHIAQFWEGEDIDQDSGIHHVSKAIASLVVLRDAMIQDVLNDDRPPPAQLDKVRSELGETVNRLLDKYPTPTPPFTKSGENETDSQSVID
jgi:hypothetical protein